MSFLQISKERAKLQRPLCHGSRSWKVRKWQYFTGRKIFLPHSSRLARDVLVPNPAHPLVASTSGKAIVKPPFAFQVEHDETVARLVLELDRQGLLESYVFEPEMKAEELSQGRVPSKLDFAKYPDAVLKLRGQATACKIALEVELSRKSPKRYRELLHASLNRKDIGAILFLARQKAIFEGLRSAMREIRYPDWERPILESDDAIAAVNFVREKLPQARIGAIGISMGGAAALLGKGPIKVDALVLESVYTDIETAIRNRIKTRVGFIPFVEPILTSLLIRFIEWKADVSRTELSPLSRVADVRIPIMILYGERDQYTTGEESLNFDKASWISRAHGFSNAGHVDLYKNDPKAYEEYDLSFFKDALDERNIKNPAASYFDKKMYGSNTLKKAGSNAQGSCETSSEVSGECFTIVGQLVSGNGTPGFKLRADHAQKQYGLAGKGDNSGETPIVPPPVERIFAKHSKDFLIKGKALCGEFYVCPIFAYRKGALPNICVENASKLRISERDVACGSAENADSSQTESEKFQNDYDALRDFGVSRKCESSRDCIVAFDQCGRCYPVNKADKGSVETIFFDACPGSSADTAKKCEFGKNKTVKCQNGVCQ